MEEVGPPEGGTNRTSPSQKQTSEEDNYMELYVGKELNDKIEPLEA